MPKTKKKSNKKKTSLLERTISKGNALSPRAKLLTFAVVFGVIGVASLKLSGAASAYTTLYSPNKDANATLLACRSTKNGAATLRLKYIGNDSPFITLKTAFGPEFSNTTDSQKLKKYVNNWQWEGDYQIPNGATSVRAILIFDDNSKDKAVKPLTEIVACSKLTTSPPPAPTPVPNPTPTPTPSPTSPPTPAPNPPAGGIIPLQPGTSWDWQLSGTPNTAAVEAAKPPSGKKMFDYDPWASGPGLIGSLHAKGIVAICYFSAGTWESGRSDSNALAPYRGKLLPEWGEYYVDYRQQPVLDVMKARMQQAKNWGCDGVEPDNVDGYTAGGGGFSNKLTANDQLVFNKWLAATGRSLGLSVGLKNDVDQVPQLAQYFDWALNEQCFQYGDECESLAKYKASFIDNNKAVFGVEYKLATSQFCTTANSRNYDWLSKDLNLTSGKRTACRNG